VGKKKTDFYFPQLLIQRNTQQSATQIKKKLNPYTFPLLFVVQKVDLWEEKKKKIKKKRIPFRDSL